MSQIGSLPRTTYITDVPPSGTAVDIDYPTEILWDNGTEILWDDLTTIMWSNTVATSPDKSLNSLPRTTWSIDIGT